MRRTNGYRLPRLAWLSAAAALLCVPSQGAAGEQARASIRISVSVAPRFDKVVREDTTGVPTVALRSVDPGFRYRVDVQALDPAPSGREAPSTQRQLLLVVPD